MLRDAAGVGDVSIKSVCDGSPIVPAETLIRLVRAAYVLDIDSSNAAKQKAHAGSFLAEATAQQGISAVAKRLGMDPSNLLKVISGNRRLSERVANAIHRTSNGGSEV